MWESYNATVIQWDCRVTGEIWRLLPFVKVMQVYKYGCLGSALFTTEWVSCLPRTIPLGRLFPYLRPEDQSRSFSGSLWTLMTAGCVPSPVVSMSIWDGHETFPCNDLKCIADTMLKKGSEIQWTTVEWVCVHVCTYGWFLHILRLH